MDYSRREIVALFAATAGAAAQTTQAPAALPTLTSKVYPFDELPTRTNQQTGTKGHKVLEGVTHGGFHIESHITELMPGQMPHPPHHHLHEEMILVREGTMEVTIAGKSATMGPGSVGFVASGEEHGWKNVGTGHARYFVMAVGRDT